jgi:hypothetical protein
MPTAANRPPSTMSPYFASMRGGLVACGRPGLLWFGRFGARDRALCPSRAPPPIAPGDTG